MEAFMRILKDKLLPKKTQELPTSSKSQIEVSIVSPTYTAAARSTSAYSLPTAHGIGGNSISSGNISSPSAPSSGGGSSPGFQFSPEFLRSYETLMKTKRFMELAYQAYDGRDYKTSEYYCHQANQIDPPSANTFLLLSAIYYKAGEIEKCTEALKRTIELKPNLPEAYLNLANIARSKGMLKESLVFFQHVIRLNPSFVEGYISFGSTLDAVGRKEQAIQAYEVALYLKPNQLNVQTEIGNVYRSLGKFERAGLCYMEVLKKKPDYTPALYGAGCVFSDTGETLLAMQFFERATIFQPPILNACVRLGQLYKSAKMYDKAATSYLRALELKPENPAIHAILANVFQENGKLDLAIEHYRQATKQDENFADAYCGMGDCYWKKGMINAAEICYSQVLRLSPYHKEALEKMVQLGREKADQLLA